MPPPPMPSTTTPFVPLRRRHRRRTHVVPKHLLLVAGVGFACVVSAVLLLQELQRRTQQHDVREVANAVAGGDKLDIDALLQRVTGAASTSPR